MVTSFFYIFCLVFIVEGFLVNEKPSSGSVDHNCTTPRLSICDKCSGDTLNPHCREHDFDYYCYRENHYTQNGLVTKKGATNLTFCQSTADLNTENQQACKSNPPPPGTRCIDCCFMSTCHHSDTHGHTLACNSENHIKAFISHHTNGHQDHETTLKHETKVPSPSTTTTTSTKTTSSTTTTTTTTTTATTTTTRPTTTSTTKRTTLDKLTLSVTPPSHPFSSGGVCQKCKIGTNSKCSINDIVICPDHEPYCLNTFLKFPDPSLNVITKRCASETDCHFFSLDLMANRHNCSAYPGFPKDSDFGQCHYCCKTAKGSLLPCNIDNIPTSPTTTTATSTPVLTTSTPVPTTTSTPVPTTSTPVPTTTSTPEPTTASTPAPTTTTSTPVPTTTSTPKPTTTSTPEPTTATRAPPTTTHKQTTSHVTTTQIPTTQPTTTTSAPVTSAPRFCQDNITACKDNPLAKCAEFDQLYGLCKNPKDIQRVLDHCPAQCGKCNEFCQSKITTPVPLTTTISTYHCPSSQDVCTDDHHVDCKNFLSIGLCSEPAAVKYCPVTCKLCDQFCNSLLTTQTTTTMAPTTNTATTQKSTVQVTTTSGTTKAQKNYCHVCTGLPFLCERLHQSSECPTDQPYCINRITNNVDGTKTVVRSCASKKECEDDWWQQTSSRADCIGYDVSSPTFKSFKCAFCCTVSNCNLKIVPDNLFIGAK